MKKKRDWLPGADEMWEERRSRVYDKVAQYRRLHVELSHIKQAVNSFVAAQREG